MKTSLPQPSAEAAAHSAQLVEHIKQAITQAGGWISFADYMHLALYAPGMGYYSAGAAKFGASGDFVTAPELSPLFARTLARQVAEVLQQVGGDILELGAGRGRLAADLLVELDSLGQLPARYGILEVSAYLREVQQQYLQQRLSPHLFSRVAWLDALPEQWQGVVLGNEVLDALPVHRIEYTNGPGTLAAQWHAVGVTVEDGMLAEAVRPLSAELQALASARHWPLTADHYVSEISQAADALVSSLSASLVAGVALLIDYGFSQREYYHPQRSQGTLMCHYRHQAHGDVLWYPGLQDLTAHVDFTAVAERALANGAALLGYSSQAQFLINCGIVDLIAEVSPEETARYAPLVSSAQTLLSPAEMGDLFKVIAFGKEVSESLLGFRQGDKRHTL